MKKFRYAAEALLVYILYYTFKVFPPPIASGIGGFIGRFVGPKLSASRKAHRHLEYAFPEMSVEQRNEVVCKMWDHLGRLFAEYPHLKTISEKYTTVVNAHHMQNSVTAERPTIYIGGHIGNFEVNTSTALWKMNIPIDITFREPNNPWVAKLLSKARTFNGKLKAYPKSRDSASMIIKAMREKRSLGILIDQKYNPGIEAQFFGRPAMTNPIFISLAHKFNAPVHMTRCIRDKGCHFTLYIGPALNLYNEDGSKRETLDILDEANKKLEEWITEKPEQWIWLHKRWK